VCRPLDEQERARAGVDLPWLSRPGQVAIVDLERRKFSPCAVAFSLRWWSYFVQNPYHRLYDPRYGGCGIFECCPDPAEVRYILDVACHVLPKRDAKAFRRRLADLDAQW
jgi:hypothetical protein